MPLECGVERTDVAAAPALNDLPTVLANKWHEPHRRDFGFLQLFSSTSEHVQGLLFLVAEWDENSTALGELFVVRLGHLWRAGADENRIVRCVLAPAKSAVSEQE